MQSDNILTVLKSFVNVLEKYSISYCIGGSIASSVYGLPRSTMDIDIVADIQSIHISDLITDLQNEFYIDEMFIIEAINKVSSFNIIHLYTALKIDVFIYNREPHPALAFTRKRKDRLIESDDASEFYFTSPEDIILHKLNWFKLGNQESEKQWLDVLGVIKVQGRLLDNKYLIKWAHELEIQDLLIRAFSESNISLK